MIIPTSDRRVSARSTTLVISTYGGPYLQHVIGDRGEHIVVHPSLPVSPFRFMKYGDYLYIAGGYPSVFDGKHFMGLKLNPTPYVTTSGSILGNKLMLVSEDAIYVYDLITRNLIKDFYEFSTLHFIQPVENGYVGSCQHIVAHVDRSFNVIRKFRVKGMILHYALYDGEYYYTSEDHKYVRKYDENGNLVAEKFLFYLTNLVMGSDGLYAVYDDGILKLDSNLNVVDRIDMVNALTVCELGQYLYVSSTTANIYKIDKATKSIVNVYSFPRYVVWSMRPTDDGNLVVVLEYTGGPYYINVYTPDMNLLYSASTADIPFIYRVFDAWKVPGTNRILASSPPYGINFEYDMSTKQLTGIYSNFTPYDIDYNGAYYVAALPIKGVVLILNNNLEPVGSLPMGSPATLRFYGKKLYVADNLLNAVFVYDDSFNLIEQYDLSKVFTNPNYPVWTIGRVKDKWYATDLITKVVLFDDNFRPVMEIPITIANEAIADFTEYKGNLYMLGNWTFTLYQVDYNGRVLAKYTYPYSDADKVHPSHTGGLVFVGPSNYIRFYRDMQVEKSCIYYTRFFYRTPKGNYVGSTYTYGPISSVREYDLDGNMLRRVIISNIIAYQACVLSDDNIVIADTFNYEIRKYGWNGNLLWRISTTQNPRISPRYDFSGVWFYGADVVRIIDLNGNVKDFISEPGTFFAGVYEDDRYVYVLEAHPKQRIRRYSKDGKLLGIAYETDEPFGLVWLTGDVYNNTAPLHVFR